MTEFAKRDFTQDERDALAAKGHAMPDGSYPISTVADLDNAVQAFGRAKNPTATKKHIISRARALNAVDRLPLKWNVSQEKTKASEISDALGISTEPAKLNDKHIPAIDDMHDAIGATKVDQQGKGNYATSTHLSAAQRHLKDAKSVLDTKALNSDTKHVLAKAALGKASQSLTHATREASAPDKSAIHDHNENLRAFAANPPADFAKYNDNHGEGGRFTSVDGTTGVPVNGGHSGSLNATVNAMRDVHRTYADKVRATQMSGKPMSADMLDTAQTKNDATGHLADAITSLQHDDAEAAHESLRNAASTLSGDKAFSSHADTVNGIADTLGKKIGKSLSLNFAEIDFAKMNENHDEKGRFAAGDAIANSAAGLSVHAETKAKQFADHYTATNDKQAFHAANKMAMAKIYADAAQKAAESGNLKDAAANLANAHQTAYSAAKNLESSSNPDTNRLSEKLTMPYGRAQAEAQSAVTQHNAW